MRDVLPLQEIFQVAREFGISIRPQLVQIEALPLSLGLHTVRYEAVQQEIDAIGERKDETEQSGYADELRQ